MKNQKKNNKFFFIILLFLTITHQTEKSQNEEKDSSNKNKKNSQLLKTIMYYILLVIIALLLIIFVIALIGRFLNCLRSFFSQRNQSNDHIPTSANSRINSETTEENEITSKNKLISTLFTLIQLENGEKISCDFIINNCLVGIFYNSNQDIFNQNCSICQESFKKNEYSFETGCKHIFHQNCISEYIITELKQNWKKVLNINEFDIFCPNCKASLLVKKNNNNNNKKLETHDDFSLKESVGSYNNINIYDRVSVKSMKKRIKGKNDVLNSNTINDTI